MINFIGWVNHENWILENKATWIIIQIGHNNVLHMTTCSHVCTTIATETVQQTRGTITNTRTSTQIREFVAFLAWIEFRYYADATILRKSTITILVKYKKYHLAYTRGRGRIHTVYRTFVSKSHWTHNTPQQSPVMKDCTPNTWNVSFACQCTFLLRTQVSS